MNYRVLYPYYAASEPPSTTTTTKATATATKTSTTIPTIKNTTIKNNNYMLALRISHIHKHISLKIEL